MSLDVFSDHSRKKAIIGLIVEMIIADGKTNASELKFVAYVGKQLNLTDDEVDAVLRNPSDHSLTPPAAEHERLTILYLLLFAMQADAMVTAEEERLIYTYALKLGFREAIAKNLIDLMKTYVGKQMPAGAMLQEVKKYLN